MTRYFNPRIPQGMRHVACGLWGKPYSDFNPRIPQGMRRYKAVRTSGFPSNFNPRIPQGMRLHERTGIYSRFRFQSTHSAGNATFRRKNCAHIRRNFNPRIPQGMRRQQDAATYTYARFQSTHSAGNATLRSHCPCASPRMISIHAFRRECDSSAGCPR